MSQHLQSSVKLQSFFGKQLYLLITCFLINTRKDNSFNKIGQNCFQTLCALQTVFDKFSDLRQLQSIDPLPSLSVVQICVRLQVQVSTHFKLPISPIFLSLSRYFIFRFSFPQCLFFFWPILENLLFTFPLKYAYIQDSKLKLLMH